MTMDNALIFLIGAMVGQIILIIGLNLWEWWDHLDDPEPQPPHPDTQQMYWDWNADTQTYEMRAQ